MFSTKRENLIPVINIMQRKACAYDMYPINVDSEPPHFCDCKYGYDTPKSTWGEKNGCPELRLIKTLLENMTDAEYNEIVSRNKTTYRVKL